MTCFLEKERNMNITTQRLILRSPKPEDAQAYCAIHNSEFVLRYNAMAPTTAERMCAKFQDREYRENTVFLEEKKSGEPIGAIFLEEDDLRYGKQASRGDIYRSFRVRGAHTSYMCRMRSGMRGHR
jgi:RimJ/RimL family protein N-acetyltransferase